MVINNLKAIVKTIGRTKWFIKNSWIYIVDKPVNIMKFFRGVIPAWIKFSKIIYKDYRRSPSDFGAF